MGAAPQRQSLIHTQRLMACGSGGCPCSGASAGAGALRYVLGTRGAPMARQHPLPQCLFHGTWVVGWGRRGETGKQGQFLN